MGGHAHSHSSGAETFCVWGQRACRLQEQECGWQPILLLLSCDSIKEEEKTPPKKYAIKLPRDLTSRFEQGQEMKRKEAIKAEEENRWKQEEARLLVCPPSSALKP